MSYQQKNQEQFDMKIKQLRALEFEQRSTAVNNKIKQIQKLEDEAIEAAEMYSMGYLLGNIPKNELAHLYAKVDRLASQLASTHL